ncbi:MAG: hypothetical protein JNM00_11670, partial [Flavobacteriales bacterium]|nr:hypothetical protein [Flavobacteriales bacterium]
TVECDDGSCLYNCGCTDAAACNYDALADYNDGTCTYPGCLDPAACNYWAGYGCDNGTCTYPGCADVYAINYDPDAGCMVIADCIYPDFCSDPASCNFGINPNEQYCVMGWFGNNQWGDLPYYYSYPFLVERVSVSAGTLPGMTYLGSISNHHYFVSDYSTNGPGAFADALAMGVNCVTFNSASENNTVYGWYSGIVWIGFNDIDNNGVFTWQSGTSSYTNWGPDQPDDNPAGDICVYPGCTDPAACNFNYYAGCDDGSCYFPGCTDSYACNYDPAAGCYDGSCLYPGCTDPAATNYWSGAGCDDGSCYYCGCMEPTACNYDPAATCNYWWTCTYPGCNDDAACNFNSNAGCDDGSCYYGTTYTIDVPDDGYYYYIGAYWALYDENSNYITAGYAPHSQSICLPEGCYSLYLQSNYGYDVGSIQFSLWNGEQLVYSQNWPGTSAGTYYIPLGASADCSFAGCNDPLACNYDPAATVSDGSCYFPYVLYEDLDGDGYGTEVVIDPAYCDYNVNGWPANTALQSGDCNDNDYTIHPNAYEYCDGIDNNCDGSLDNGQGSYFYADNDGDGFGNPYDYIFACEPDATHFLADYSDCNDSNPDVHPGAEELCNDVDDDCDGYVDEQTGNLLFVTDASWDDAVYPNPYSCYGNPFVFAGFSANSIWGTTHPSTLFSKTFNYTPQPGVDVWIYGFEDDGMTLYINGQSIYSVYDNSVSNFQLNLTPYLVNGSNLLQVQMYNAYGCGDFAAAVFEMQPAVWFADYDGDGYGNALAGNSECNAPPGYVANDDDCDDYNYYINPVASEVCNDVDDDCDGLVDDDDPDMSGGATWYADLDGDGYGDATNTIVTCDPPVGYVVNADDCDDLDGLEFPGAVWYTDADQDGYGTGAYQVACTRPPGTYNIDELASVSGDCDDNDPD